MSLPSWKVRIFEASGGSLSPRLNLITSGYSSATLLIRLCAWYYGALVCNDSHKRDEKRRFNTSFYSRSLSEEWVSSRTTRAMQSGSINISGEASLTKKDFF